MNFTAAATRVDGQGETPVPLTWPEEILRSFVQFPTRLSKFLKLAWADAFRLAGFLLTLGYAIGFGYRVGGLGYFYIAPRVSDFNPLLVVDALIAFMTHGAAFVMMWTILLSAVASAALLLAKSLLGLAACTALALLMRSAGSPRLVSLVPRPFPKPETPRRTKKSDVMMRVAGVLSVGFFYGIFYVFGGAVGQQDAEAFFRGRLSLPTPLFLNSEPFHPRFLPAVFAELPAKYRHDIQADKVFILTEDDSSFITFDQGVRDKRGRPSLTFLTRAAVLAY